MSRQNWDDEYESPLFIFPDDEESSEYEAMPIVFDDDEGAPASPAPTQAAPEDGISVVPSAAPAGDSWSAQGTSSLTRRSSASKAPVEYPEGSLGAFSTPEDYEAHMNAAQDDNDDGQEYDEPIFLFPPDEDEKPERNRLSSSTDDGDLDDSIGISFSRYSAESKEGEFFFMPFLDIPDEIEDEEEEEDEGEEVSFSFRKVDAEQVKKEKEFIFMPFLNVSEEAEEEPEEEETTHRRSSKGTIFDEGLYLIPLESEEEEQAEEEKKPEEPEEDDSGIYFVSTEGGVVPEAPKVQRTEKKTTLKSEPPAAPERKKKKKSPEKPDASTGKKPPAKTGSKTGKGTVGKNATAEEQFRAAMRNVSPEIRAAVKNDPVQRAALEQAVRIALVQQAAQEAVEKATGRPVFGGSSSAVSSRKKKRIPRPPQSQKPVSSFLGGSSRASSMSFSPITLRTPYDDGGVSEFGVTDEQKKAAETPAASQSSAGTLISAGTAGVPDANQDSILALLNASGQGTGAGQSAAPDSAQDSVLDTLAGKTSGAKPRSAYQSPAAVRAAMRTGLDYEAPQPQTAAAPAAKTAVSAAEQEMQAKRSGCLIWIIVAFIAFFVGLIAILILPNISKQNSFDKAVDLMNDGNYVQAIELFEEFKENDTKFYDTSRTNISECAYKLASQYYSEGKYYEAYNLLMDKAIVNEETTALALRCNYYYAEQRYAEGDWQTAAAAYANLLNVQYEDSQDKYNICQYQVASQDAEVGDYLQAYQGFALLGDYSDSRYRAACMVCKAWAKYYQSVTDVQLSDAIAVLSENASNGEALDILNSVYVKAVEFRQTQQHTNAYKTFQALGDYSDSGYMEALSLYEIWSANPDYGTLSQREEAMEELRVRVGNDEAVEALSSSGFNPVRLMGRWTDGESTISLQRTSPDSDELTLVLQLLSHDGTVISVESTDIGFDGNVLYRLTDPDDSTSAEALFEITGFDSLVAMEPGSFSFYCFLNNSEYTLARD